MGLTYDDSRAVSLFDCLKTEMVRADHIEVGDIIKVADVVIRVSRIEHAEFPPSRRVYPIWAHAVCEIVPHAGLGTEALHRLPDYWMVPRIPRSFLVEPEPDLPPPAPARLEQYEVYLNEVLRFGPRAS